MPNVQQKDERERGIGSMEEKRGVLSAMFRWKENTHTNQLRVFGLGDDEILTVEQNSV